MSTLRDRLRAGDAQAQGFTMIETIVVTLVFTFILSIVSAGAIEMIRQTDRAGDRGNDLSAGQKVLSLLDHQVRYANEINRPGTGSDGAYYFEFRTGNTDQQQTCHQWRYIPSSGAVQWRTWKPPFKGAGSASASLTDWAPAATGVSLVSTTPIWQIDVPTAGSTTDAGSTKETFTVDFKVSSGVPTKQVQQFQLTLTAINSVSPTPPANTCTDIGRPT
ncbi:MAG TPA: type II secretion system protein [Mycobacteriales bacterium]|nr:type II secretion system protein [Mycobacteriales bacterium]